MKKNKNNVNEQINKSEQAKPQPVNSPKMDAVDNNIILDESKPKAKSIKEFAKIEDVIVKPKPIITEKSTKKKRRIKYR